MPVAPLASWDWRSPEYGPPLLPSIAPSRFKNIGGRIAHQLLTQLLIAWFGCEHFISAACVFQFPGPIRFNARFDSPSKFFSDYKNVFLGYFPQEECDYGRRSTLVLARLPKRSSAARWQPGSNLDAPKLDIGEAAEQSQSQNAQSRCHKCNSLSS